MALPVSHRVAPVRVASGARPPRWTFGVCGPRVRVTGGLAALAVLALAIAVSGPPGVGSWLPLMLLATVVVSTAVHEGGHAWAAHELGYRVEWIVLGAITGGTAWFGRDDRPLERSAVALAGPAASAALVLGLLGVRVAMPVGTGASVVELAIAVNVLAMVVNLLPFGHSDGALLVRGLAGHATGANDRRARPSGGHVIPPPPPAMWGPPPGPSEMSGPPPPPAMWGPPPGPLRAAWAPPATWGPPSGPPGPPPRGESGGPPGPDPTLGVDAVR